MTKHELTAISRLFNDLVHTALGNQFIARRKLDLFTEEHSELSNSLNRPSILSALGVTL